MPRGCNRIISYPTREDKDAVVVTPSLPNMPENARIGDVLGKPKQLTRRNDGYRLIAVQLNLHQRDRERRELIFEHFSAHLHRRLFG